jgi:deoxyribodipyrimidine photo-lyase
MTTLYKNGLFIFHRDLRVADNTGLIMAARKCARVFPIFVFTPEQIGRRNKYRSANSVQFMLDCLRELVVHIKLQLFYGATLAVVKDCLAAFSIDYVCFNADYTPYAVARDAAIAAVCKKAGVACEFAHDYYLVPPGTITSAAGEAYRKFTPYYNAAIQHPVARVNLHEINNIAAQAPVAANRITLAAAVAKFTNGRNAMVPRSGRTLAIEKLLAAVKSQRRYSETRDCLATPTSGLSAYIKFGCVSVREVYWRLRANAEFVRQLIWRDFYAQMFYGHPRDMVPKNTVKWGNNAAWLAAWKVGRTGFPAVDAGMRELCATGMMHNRARLIVASLLIKILHIDWRIGEQYFAQMLVDYDVASNNGNWQWSHKQPAFRTFNPWAQGREHDPECVYIKKWIPELRAISPRQIHNWRAPQAGCTYPGPICDFDVQKNK